MKSKGITGVIKIVKESFPVVLFIMLQRNVRHFLALQKLERVWVFFLYIFLYAKYITVVLFIELHKVNITFAPESRILESGQMTTVLYNNAVCCALHALIIEFG